MNKIIYNKGKDQGSRENKLNKIISYKKIRSKNITKFYHNKRVKGNL